MTFRPSRMLAVVLIAATSCAREPAGLSGTVTVGGRPGAGLIVRAVRREPPMAASVTAERAGRYAFPALAPGRWVLEVIAPDRTWRADSVEIAGTPVRRDLAPAGAGEPREASSADWLGLLPDGEEKRRFVLDCTGCHLFDGAIARPGGLPRPREDWERSIGRMLSYAGATSGFPVIAHDRDSTATAAWLASRLGDRVATPRLSNVARGRAVITEYDLPLPQDLPHDVAVDRDGRVIVTGMFSHVMLVLDPETGAFDTVAIDVPRANPRAIELDGEGRWWVLLGFPRQIARHDPRSGSWTRWPIPSYPHSIALGRDGRVWFNGHFTRDPELLGALDPATGRVDTFVVPRHPMADAPGGPIPYELRLDSEDRVWLSELQGNRIAGLSPRDRSFTVHEMPQSWSAPRRFDVEANGRLWIPTYSGNELVAFDPAAGTFDRHPIPIPDAAPYVARVDARGTVWIGTSAADALLAFDPARKAFTAYPLPSRGAMVRHMAFDPRNGDIWLAYGASPGMLPARIARVRTLDRR